MNKVAIIVLAEHGSHEALELVDSLIREFGDWLIGRCLIGVRHDGKMTQNYAIVIADVIRDLLVVKSR